nr:unnamed protein product [Digitaria exilis]
MEDVIDNVNNDIVEQEESTGSIPSPLLRSTRPNKRLRSKVWDDFIPTFVDGKVPWDSEEAKAAGAYTLAIYTEEHSSCQL